MRKKILALIFVFATLLSFSQGDDTYIKGVFAIDTVIQTKVQLLKAEVATKNSNFYHICSNTDIGNYLVTTTISAIDLHYLQENMMGTLFIESTINCSVSITGFTDDGNSKVARTYGTNAIDLKAGEATSITYSCFKADDEGLVLYLIGSVMPLVDRVAPIWAVNLVSWYQFEETTGLTTADSHGTDNGTIDGALLGHTGKIGQCSPVVLQLFLTQPPVVPCRGNHRIDADDLIEVIHRFVIMAFFHLCIAPQGQCSDIPVVVLNDLVKTADGFRVVRIFQQGHAQSIINIRTLCTEGVGKQGEKNKEGHDPFHGI